MIHALIPVLGQVLDKVITDPTAREKAKQKMSKMQLDGDLKEMEIQMSAIVMEAKSADPWTSRARPSFLYVMYLLILSCMVGAVLGIWWPTHIDHVAMNLANLLDSIPEALWALFGAGYLGYTASRSYDKKKQR